jgi:hypothetical protein
MVEYHFSAPMRYAARWGPEAESWVVFLSPDTGEYYEGQFDCPGEDYLQMEELLCDVEGMDLMEYDDHVFICLNDKREWFVVWSLNQRGFKYNRSLDAHLEDWIKKSERSEREIQEKNKSELKPKRRRNMPAIRL